MDVKCDQSTLIETSGSQIDIQDKVAKLVNPGKVIIQLNGWKNVGRTLEYSFSKGFDIFQKVSGIALDLEGIAQVAGNIITADLVKKSVLLGKTITTNLTEYTLTNELIADSLDGFDDLDQRLNRLKIWGCDFIILNADLRVDSSFHSRTIPFDNADYFGIFASSVQALEMVPVIQLNCDFKIFDMEESGAMLANIMSRIYYSFFQFNVLLEGVIISQLMKNPHKSNEDNVLDIAGAIMSGLQRAHPPAIGGVVLSSANSAVALALIVDQFAKLIERVPWSITCGFNCAAPANLKPGFEEEILAQWLAKLKYKIEILSNASLGKYIAWKTKPTELTPEFIKSHDY